MNRGCCCIVDGSGSSSSVVADATECDAWVRGSMSTVSIKQLFTVGDKDVPMAQYQFPLDVRSAVWDCQISVMPPDEKERKLQLRLDEIQRAKKTYEDAQKTGKTAALFVREQENLFTMELGNLPARSRIVVIVQYDAELRTLNDHSSADAKMTSLTQQPSGSTTRVQFVLPTGQCPRYALAQNAAATAQAKLEERSHAVMARISRALSADTKSVGPALFHANIHIQMPLPITGVISSTKRQMDITHTPDNPTQALVSCLLSQEEDLVLDIGQAAAPKAVAQVQWSPQLKEAMLAMTFAPPALSAEQSVDIKIQDSVEILVDCSGSMEGSRIQQAKDVLNEWLSALPSGQLFNMHKFGSLVEHWQPSPVINDQDGVNLAAARAWTANVAANLGGTEILSALQCIFATDCHNTEVQTDSKMATQQDQGPKVRERQLLLLTDGEVTGIPEIVREIRNSRWRVHAIGIGRHASEDLIMSVARVARGRAIMVPGSPLQADKASAANAVSLGDAVAFVNDAVFQPAVFVTSVRTPASETGSNQGVAAPTQGVAALSRWPERATAMYSGEMYTVYVPLGAQIPTQVHLDLGTNVSGHVHSFVLPIGAAERIGDGEQLHRFAARARITEIEDRVARAAPFSDTSADSSLRMLDTTLPSTLLALISEMEGGVSECSSLEAERLRLSLRYGVHCTATAFVGVDESGAVVRHHAGAETLESCSGARAAGGAFVGYVGLAACAATSSAPQPVMVCALQPTGPPPTPSPPTPVLSRAETFAAKSLEAKFSALCATKTVSGSFPLTDIVRWLLPAATLARLGELETKLSAMGMNISLQSAISKADANANASAMNAVAEMVLACVGTRLVRSLFRSVFAQFQVRWIRLDAMAARAENADPTLGLSRGKNIHALILNAFPLF